jgi:uncharacterized membrane protein
MDTGRLEAFNEGVIIITITVLEMKPPRDATVTASSRCFLLTL